MKDIRVSCLVGSNFFLLPGKGVAIENYLWRTAGVGAQVGQVWW